MKKALLIMPDYFEYPKYIAQELTKNKYEVTYVNDRPSSNVFFKCIQRFNPHFVSKRIKNYSKKINLMFKKNKYDICIIILGQSFYGNNIKKWRESSPNTKFIFYAWDSFDNFENLADLSLSCDKAYSFDEKDVSNYKHLSFLPLFFIENKNEFTNKIYDFSYVGTIKLGKYKFIDSIIKTLKTRYSNYYLHLYIQSPIVLLFYKIRYKEFRNIKFSDVKFFKLKYDETIEIFSKSRFVIDCQMAKQNGLTMRTFEVLGVKTKLITTNDSVKKYDFYKPENIYIFHDAIDFNDLFFKSEYVKIDKEIKEKYSLNHWIKEILKGV